jgi:hypothetical protein
MHLCRCLRPPFSCVLQTGFVVVGSAVILPFKGTRVILFDSNDNLMDRLRD